MLWMLFACGGEEAPDALDVTVRLGLGGEGTETETGTGLVIDTAWISVGEVRSEEAEGCGTKDKVEAVTEGPIEADLFAPSDIVLEARATALCSVGVGFVRAESLTAAPIHLDGYSLLFQGTRADGVEFEVRSKAAFDRDLDAAGLEVAAGAADLLVAVDVGAWLQAADLDGATPQDDGQVRVDDIYDPDRLDSFDEGFDGVLSLWVDGDADGRVGPEDAQIGGE